MTVVQKSSANVRGRLACRKVDLAAQDCRGRNLDIIPFVNAACYFLSIAPLAFDHMSSEQQSRLLAPPQGIDDTKVKQTSWHRHANPATLLLLGTLLGAAMLGTFGGQPHPSRKIATSAAEIEMQFPEILRNGEFFEMRAKITARRSFDDMRLSVSAPYWRDLTINTMLPAPSEEMSENGEFILSYGPLQPGQTLTLKFDGQINPPMFAGTQGNIKIMDGDDIVVTIPVKLRVYP